MTWRGGAASGSCGRKGEEKAKKKIITGS